MSGGGEAKATRSDSFKTKPQLFLWFQLQTPLMHRKLLLVNKRKEPGCMDHSQEDTVFYSVNKQLSGRIERQQNSLLWASRFSILGNMHCITFCMWMFYIDCMVTSLKLLHPSIYLEDLGLASIALVSSISLSLAYLNFSRHFLHPVVYIPNQIFHTSQVCSTE